MTMRAPICGLAAASRLPGLGLGDPAAHRSRPGRPAAEAVTEAVFFVAGRLHAPIGVVEAVPSEPIML